MSAIIFPTSPTVGQVFVVGLVSYTWTGVYWSASQTTPVTSFNTRTGAVTLLDTDVNTALGYTAFNPATTSVTVLDDGTY